MTKSDERRGAAVKFPPPFLPVATIVAGYILGRVLPFPEQYDLATPQRYVIGGIIAAAAVLILVAWPFFQFRKTGQDPTPWTPTPEIVVGGLYQFTRNPMYLGMLVFCVGFAIILSEIWILILTPVCGWMIHLIAIRNEEAYLEQKFGDTYRAYKRSVRRWI